MNSVQTYMVPPRRFLESQVFYNDRDPMYVVAITKTNWPSNPRNRAVCGVIVSSPDSNAIPLRLIDFLMSGHYWRSGS